MRETRFGLLVPTAYPQSPPSAEELARFFRRADDLGFDSLWVIDRIFHPNPVLEPLAVLTWAAAVTHRIRLGTAVLLLAFRNPVLVAKYTATLDFLSGGRLTLGVSLGGRPEEYTALGVPLRQRPSRLEENLEVMRLLWTGRGVHYSGRYIRLEGATVEPRPLQPGGIPVYMGGASEPALRRAGRLAQGWVMGAMGGPEAFRSAWSRVVESARQAGRDPSSLTAGKLLYICVDGDRQRARERLEAHCRAYYGPAFDVDRAAVFGPPEACAERVRAFAEAGVGLFLLALPWPDVGQLERLAGQVLPLLSP